MTLLELMLVCDDLMATYGENLPVMMRDSDPENPLWFKPVLYHGRATIMDTKTHEEQRILLLSETNEPFPGNCYLKYPDKEEDFAE